MYVMPSVVSPSEWADRTFAAVDLADRRRECRAVTMAAGMMRHPDAALPQHMHAASALTAAYRLLDEDHVTHAARSQPHWDATRQPAGRQDLAWVS
jgi:transposase-like protein